MPSVTVNDTQGLLVKAGSGFTTTGAVVHTALPTSPVQQITTSPYVVAAPGVYTISGTSAITVVLPLAASVPGGMFCFRNASAKAHVITGSAEVPGTTVLAVGSGSRGSKITNSTAVGDAVSLWSNGLHFLVLPVTGTAVIS